PRSVLVDDAAGGLASTKLGMIFGRAVVDQIVHPIVGTAIYVAPLAGLPSGISFAASVKNKVSYAGGLLQFAGAMTTSERSDLLAAPADAAYQAAVNALAQQPQTLIQNTLSGFLDVTAAIKTLVTDLPSLDANLDPVLLDATGSVTTDQTKAVTTAIAGKFAYVLARLLPYLCDQLSRSLVKQ